MKGIDTRRTNPPAGARPVGKGTQMHWKSSGMVVAFVISLVISGCGSGQEQPGLPSPERQSLSDMPDGLDDVPGEERQLVRDIEKRFAVSVKSTTDGSGRPVYVVRLDDEQIAQLEPLAPLLARLTHLKRLYLAGDELTDAELAHVAGLTQLEVLHLYSWNDRLTDAGLEQIGDLKGLRELELFSRSVTDAGLEHLAGLPELEYLFISSDRVTDAGLAHLEGLGRLRTLCLDRTQVTEAGAEKLQRAIPRLRVHRRVFNR